MLPLLGTVVCKLDVSYGDVGNFLPLCDELALLFHCHWRNYGEAQFLNGYFQDCSLSHNDHLFVFFFVGLIMVLVIFDPLFVLERHVAEPEDLGATIGKDIHMKFSSLLGSMSCGIDVLDDLFLSHFIDLVFSIKHLHFMSLQLLGTHFVHIHIHNLALKPSIFNYLHLKCEVPWDQQRQKACLCSAKARILLC